MKGKWGATAREGRREEEGRGRGTGADVCVHECVRDGVGGRDFKGRKGGRGGGGKAVGTGIACCCLMRLLGWLRPNKAGCGSARLVAAQQGLLRSNKSGSGPTYGWLRPNKAGCGSSLGAGQAAECGYMLLRATPSQCCFVFFLLRSFFSCMFSRRCSRSEQVLNRRDF